MTNHVNGSQQRIERGDGWPETNRSSIGLIQLFGQLMMLPLSVFVYSMDVFVRTIQSVQQVAGEGMDIMLGSTDQTPRESDILTQTSIAAPVDRTASNMTETPGVAPGDESGLESSLAISSTDSGAKDNEKNLKETIKMNDTDLSDDMLKLVRYKILFVKRDYETAFPEREELVFDNMTGDAFAAWKVAEFIQRLGAEPVPPKWIKKNYPKGRTYTAAQKAGTASTTINTLDEDDKKYLRVYFEVLARYEREEARHAEDQIKVLEDIRDRL
jgi:hypothetical protein